MQTKREQKGNLWPIGTEGWMVLGEALLGRRDGLGTLGGRDRES